MGRHRKLETEGSPGGRGKLSLSTVREVHAILSSAYTAAIKEGRQSGPLHAQRVSTQGRRGG
jgi:hypothetical protein